MHIYNFPLSLNSVLLIYTSNTYIYVLLDTLLTLDYNALKNPYYMGGNKFPPTTQLDKQNY